jgi:hypothetical protein
MVPIATHSGLLGAAEKTNSSASFASATFFAEKKPAQPEGCAG